MSKDNHQQSVGGQGAIDGLSGSEHSGTEGADSGQGVNKGAGAGSHGHVDQQSDGRQQGGDLHGVGPARSGMTGGGTDGNATGKDDKKNQPAP
ncbi:MAG: hypothetical protein ABIQ08_05475 [Duganella sp.]